MSISAIGNNYSAKAPAFKSQQATVASQSTKTPAKEQKSNNTGKTFMLEAGRLFLSLAAGFGLTHGAVKAFPKIFNNATFKSSMLNLATFTLGCTTADIATFKFLNREKKA